MTIYACRIHVDQRVSWRGTGCPECEREPRRGRNERDADAEPAIDLPACPPVRARHQ